MFTTANQVEMQDLLRIFNKDTREVYGNHSYSAGYLESMIVHMLPHLPKRVQKEFISDMERACVRNKTKLIEAQQTLKD